MLATSAEVIASFKALSPNAIPLSGVAKYTAKGDLLYVDPKSGFLTSARKMSATDIVGYWSQKIFSSSDPEDYSALNPFAQGRLLYALLTYRKFLSDSGCTPANTHLCDFATGQGVLLELAKQHAADWTLSGTEDSAPLVNSLVSRGFNVVKTG